MASQIPSQQAALPDPFSDISCGGWEISDEPRGRMSLWAVSLQGKVHTHTHTCNSLTVLPPILADPPFPPQVWFREGIDHHNPEGSSWEEMTLPGEVVQISCGPGDLVWAVLWEGQLIVREGVSRDCPKGTAPLLFECELVLVVCIEHIVSPRVRYLLGGGGLPQS